MSSNFSEDVLKQHLLCAMATMKFWLMPFYLSNALLTFQQEMNNIFREHLELDRHFLE